MALGVGVLIGLLLGGAVITEADLSQIDKTMDKREHPGLHNPKGYIGWLGHGDPVAFRAVLRALLGDGIAESADVRGLRWEDGKLEAPPPC
jgi:hypothetical protein